MKRKRPTILTRIYCEIALEDRRRLNWRAMRYFARRREYALAAKCRQRVGWYNSEGPV